jgi:hypothetical protein
MDLSEPDPTPNETKNLLKLEKELKFTLKRFNDKMGMDLELEIKQVPKPDDTKVELAPIVQLAERVEKMEKKILPAFKSDFQDFLN